MVAEVVRQVEGSIRAKLDDLASVLASGQARDAYPRALSGRPDFQAGARRPSPSLRDRRSAEGLGDGVILRGDPTVDLRNMALGAPFVFAAKLAA